MANSATFQALGMAAVNWYQNAVCIAVIGKNFCIIGYRHLGDALIQNTPDPMYACEKTGGLGGNTELINDRVYVVWIQGHPLGQVIIGYT